MKPAFPREQRLSPRQSHGVCALKRTVRTLGSRTIDRRTKVGRTLAGWCEDLGRDLGGLDGLSTAQKAIIEQAATTRLRSPPSSGPRAPTWSSRPPQADFEAAQPEIAAPPPADAVPAAPEIADEPPVDDEQAAPEIAEPPPADAVPADPEISDDPSDDSDDATP